VWEDIIRNLSVNGRSTYDFQIFRHGPRHLVGLYDEINSFVSFVKDAAERGSSSEMAFVLVDEPGNGKTFFVEYLFRCYREFLSQAANRRYGGISEIESQTFEDPMVMALNLHEDRVASLQALQSEYGYDDAQISKLLSNARPLAA
jgi:serine protein kinase